MNPLANAPIPNALHEIATAPNGKVRARHMQELLAMCGDAANAAQVQQFSGTMVTCMERWIKPKEKCAKDAAAVLGCVGGVVSAMDGGRFVHYLLKRIEVTPPGAALHFATALCECVKRAPEMLPRAQRGVVAALQSVAKGEALPALLAAVRGMPMRASFEPLANVLLNWLLFDKCTDALRNDLVDTVVALGDDWKHHEGILAAVVANLVNDTVAHTRASQQQQQQQQTSGEVPPLRSLTRALLALVQAVGGEIAPTTQGSATVTLLLHTWAVLCEEEGTGATAWVGNANSVVVHLLRHVRHFAPYHGACSAFVRAQLVHIHVGDCIDNLCDVVVELLCGTTTTSLTVATVEDLVTSPDSPLLRRRLHSNPRVTTLVFQTLVHALRSMKSIDAVLLLARSLTSEVVHLLHAPPRAPVEGDARARGAAPPTAARHTYRLSHAQVEAAMCFNTAVFVGAVKSPHEHRDAICEMVLTEWAGFPFEERAFEAFPEAKQAMVQLMCLLAGVRHALPEPSLLHAALLPDEAVAIKFLVLDCITMLVKRHATDVVRLLVDKGTQNTTTLWDKLTMLAWDRQASVRMRTVKLWAALAQARVLPPAYVSSLATLMWVKLNDRNQECRVVCGRVLGTTASTLLHMQGEHFGEWEWRAALRGLAASGAFHAQHYGRVFDQLAHKDAERSSEWLIRLFHVTRTPHVLHESRYNKETVHTLLRRGLVDHHVTLYWALWEAARFLVHNKLRTSHGGPMQTFELVEKLLVSCNGHSVERVLPVLRFVDALEVQIMHAYSSSASLPLVPSGPSSFFHRNRRVCEDWFVRLEPRLLHACRSALEVHMLARVALDRVHQVVSVYINTGGTQDKEAYLSEIEKQLVEVVASVRVLGDADVLQGIGTWLKSVSRSAQSAFRSGASVLSEERLHAWVQRAAAWTDMVDTAATHACGHAAEAAQRYRTLLSAMMAGDAPRLPATARFFVLQIADCYQQLGDWSALEEWHATLAVHREHCTEPELAAELGSGMDVHQIRGLASFDAHEWDAAHQHLQSAASVWRDDVDGVVDHSHHLLVKALLDMPEPTAHAAALTKLREARTLVETPLRHMGVDLGEQAFPLLMQMQTVSAAMDVHAAIVGTSRAPRGETPTEEAQAQAQGQSRRRRRRGRNRRNNKNNNNNNANNGTDDSSPATPTPALVPPAGPRGKLFRPYSVDELVAMQHRHNGNFGIWLKLLQVHEYVHELHYDAIADGWLPLNDLRLSMGISARQLRNFALADRLLRSVPDTLRVAVERERLAYDRGAHDTAAHALCELVWATHAHGKGGVVLADALVTLSEWAGQMDTMHVKALHVLERVPGDVVSAAREQRHQVVDCLLQMATGAAPTHAEAWLRYAAWSYRHGQELLEAGDRSHGVVGLNQAERARVLTVLKEAEERAGGAAAVWPAGETLESVAHRVEDVLAHVGDPSPTRGAMEKHGIAERLASVRRGLHGVCGSLPRGTMGKLQSVWESVRKRAFSFYANAIDAYFAYLQRIDDAALTTQCVGSECTGGKDGDAAAGSKASPGTAPRGPSAHRAPTTTMGGGMLPASVSAAAQESAAARSGKQSVTATLRLLLLIVRYSEDLHMHLQAGFRAVPALLFQDLVPQCCAGLQHPQARTRELMFHLLCRIGTASPEKIVYPVVVGHNTATSPSSTGAPSVLSSLSYQEVVLKLKQLLAVLRECDANLVAQVEVLVSELARVATLWEERWLMMLHSLQSDVSVRLQTVRQEERRLRENEALDARDRVSSVREKYVAIMKPVILVLERLSRITSCEPTTPEEQWFADEYADAIDQALHDLKHAPTPAAALEAWGTWKDMHRDFAKLQKRTQLTMEDLSPRLMDLQGSVIPIPGLCGGGSGGGEALPTIQSFQPRVTVLQTKTKPKKFSMLGSDGRTYTFLLKGREDLHLDERIMQFLQIVNKILAVDVQTSARKLSARTYAVIPLGDRAGLIQWVDGSLPLYSLYKHWHARNAAVKEHMARSLPPSAPQSAKQQAEEEAVAARRKPVDSFYHKLAPALREQGITNVMSRADWPAEVVRRVFLEMKADTPSDVLARELRSTSGSPAEWWSRVRTFSSSFAVMSVVGYVLGLGDRHLDNILLDSRDASCIHIDFNVCFERGARLKVPERVPFRMTQNLCRALGPTGVEGRFRVTAEHVVRVLRGSKDVLLTLLNAFAHDPLVDWAADRDNDEERKNLDLHVSLTLLASYVTETRVEFSVRNERPVTLLGDVRTRLKECLSKEQSLHRATTVTEPLAARMSELSARLDEQEGARAASVRTAARELGLSQVDPLLQLVKTKHGECMHWARCHREAVESLLSPFLPNMQQQILSPQYRGEVTNVSHLSPSALILSQGEQQHAPKFDGIEATMQTLLTQCLAAMRTTIDALLPYRPLLARMSSEAFALERHHKWGELLATIVQQPREDSSYAQVRAAMHPHASVVEADRLRAMEGSLAARVEEHAQALHAAEQECAPHLTLDMAPYEERSEQARGALDVLITSSLQFAHREVFTSDLEAAAYKVVQDMYGQVQRIDRDTEGAELFAIIKATVRNVDLVHTLCTQAQCDVVARHMPAMVAQMLPGVLDRVSRMLASVEMAASNYRKILFPELCVAMGAEDASVRDALEQLHALEERAMAFDKRLRDLSMRRTTCVHSVQRLRVELDNVAAGSERRRFLERQLEQLVEEQSQLDQHQGTMQSDGEALTRAIRELLSPSHVDSLSGGQVLLAAFETQFGAMQREYGHMEAQIQSALANVRAVVGTSADFPLPSRAQMYHIFTVAKLQTIGAVFTTWHDVFERADQATDPVVTRDEALAATYAVVKAHLQNFLTTLCIPHLGQMVHTVRHYYGEAHAAAPAHHAEEMQYVRGTVQEYLGEAVSVYDELQRAGREHVRAVKHVAQLRQAWESEVRRHQQFRWLHADVLADAATSHLAPPPERSLVRALADRTKMLQVSHDALVEGDQHLGGAEREVQELLMRRAHEGGAQARAQLAALQRRMAHRGRQQGQLMRDCERLLSLARNLLHLETFRVRTPESVAYEEANVALVEQLDAARRAAHAHEEEEKRREREAEASGSRAKRALVAELRTVRARWEEAHAHSTACAHEATKSFDALRALVEELRDATENDQLRKKELRSLVEAVMRNTKHMVAVRSIYRAARRVYNESKQLAKQADTLVNALCSVLTEGRVRGQSSSLFTQLKRIITHRNQLLSKLVSLSRACTAHAATMDLDQGGDRRKERGGSDATDGGAGTGAGGGGAGGGGAGGTDGDAAGGHDASDAAAATAANALEYVGAAGDDAGSGTRAAARRGSVGDVDDDVDDEDDVDVNVDVAADEHDDQDVVVDDDDDDEEEEEDVDDVGGGVDVDDIHDTSTDDDSARHRRVGGGAGGASGVGAGVGVGAPGGPPPRSGVGAPLSDSGSERGGSTPSQPDEAERRRSHSLLSAGWEGSASPRSNFSLQVERNQYATHVLRRVQVKLEGRDLDSKRVVSVHDQVDAMIRSAVSVENLSRMYEGWMPWI